MARRLVSSVVIFAVALSTCFVAILPSGPLLAQFDALRWIPIPTPSDEDFLVVNPSEVSVLEIGSATRWYAADIPNMMLYRSDDGGITWQDDILDNLLDASPAPTLPVWDLAVAPGDADLLVAVTDDRQEVYFSEDGGLSWIHLPSPSSATEWVPGHLIADVAISPLYTSAGDERRDIAIGIRLPNGIADGDVLVIPADGIIGSWKGQGLEMDVSSVAFSPNYADDETILAVASDTDGTFLATGYRVLGSNDTLWEVTNPYFIEISTASSGAVPPVPAEYLSPTEDELIYSDIAVPSAYDGDTLAQRVVYVSYASTTDPLNGPDDVYRIDNSRTRRMNLDRGANIQVFSRSPGWQACRR